MTYRTTRRLCILALVFCMLLSLVKVMLPPFVKELKYEHQRTLDIQLHDAIDASDPVAVVEVLNQGASVNTIPGKFYYNFPLVEAIQNTIPVDVVRKAGSYSTVTRDVPNPAEIARLKIVEADTLKIVRCLLERGADVNKPDNEGHFPLLVARDSPNDVDIIKLLLAHGAKVNVKDGDGHTALWYAQHNHNQELIHLLQQAGAKE